MRADLAAAAAALVVVGVLACSGPAATPGPESTPEPVTGRDVVKAVRFDEYRVTCFYMGAERVDWPVAIDCVHDQ